jgi:hypothetical protein
MSPAAPFENDAVRMPSAVAWGRAFRSKFDEACSLEADLDGRGFGRVPSRLWLMEADEIERLPITDFIAAFGVPRGVGPRHTQSLSHPWGESGGGDGPRGTNRGDPLSIVAQPERPQCRGPSPHSSPNTWWSFPVRAYAAAVAVIALLTG